MQTDDVLLTTESTKLRRAVPLWKRIVTNVVTVVNKRLTLRLITIHRDSRIWKRRGKQRQSQAPDGIS